MVSRSVFIRWSVATVSVPKKQESVIQQTKRSLLKLYENTVDNPSDVPVYLPLVITKVLDIYTCMERGTMMLPDVIRSETEFHTLLSEWRILDQTSYIQYMDDVKAVYDDMEMIRDMWLTTNGITIDWDKSPED